MKQNQLTYWIAVFLLSSCALMNSNSSSDLSQSKVQAPVQGNEKRSLSSTSDQLKEVYFFDTKTLSQASIKLEKFSLDREGSEFRKSLEVFLSQQQEWRERRKKNRNQPSEVESDELEQHIEFSGMIPPYNSFDPFDKGLTVSVQKMLSLLYEADHEPQNKNLKYYQVAQIARALVQKYTPPITTEFEILSLPILILKQFTHTTVDPKNYGNPDIEDPVLVHQVIDNSLSSSPVNLYSIQHVAYDSENCEYYKSKQGYGINPGFQVKCGSQIFKVKFGKEQYSGSFNSRIYKAMGYLVPTINYAPALKMKYDRKVLTEYNQRKVQTKKITVAGKTVYQFTDEIKRNPFRDISYFLMRDGSRVSADEVQNNLLPHYDKSVGIKKTDFNKEYEKNIQSIVYNPATLTLKEKEHWFEVGPWQASDLNYGDYKEVRAAMILSAWVGNYDVRKDNLRLYLDFTEQASSALRLGFADVGSGLGHSTIDLTKVSSSQVNDMVWEVTRYYPRTQGALLDDERVMLDGLTNIEPNPVFRNLKLSDAQWMLEQMCRLSKLNIQQALVATGMSAAEVVLGTEKLLHRRNKMLVDFKMPNEVVNACSVPTNIKLNYDPSVDGEIRVQNAQQEWVSAPSRDLVVRSGVVVPR